MAGGVVGSRIGAGERIEMLDVLRGLAILCILFMNIPGMGGFVGSGPEDPRIVSWTAADHFAFGATWMIDGTMRGLLQLLFGAGMMISLRGAMTPDGPVGPLDAFLRRNLWLIAFGLFNALVLQWMGDILLLYGLTALFLPPFRLLRPRTLFAIGAGMIFLSTVGGAVAGYMGRVETAHAYAAAQAKAAMHKTLSDDEKDSIDAGRKTLDARSFPPRGEEKEAIAKQVKARAGGFIANWKESFRQWSEFQFDLSFLGYNIAESLSAMLIGAALYGWGVVQGRRSTGFYVRLIAGCYGLGFAARALSLHELLKFPVTLEPSLYRTVVFTLGHLARLPISIGHVALVALLLRVGWGARLVRPLAANGKLPLTTYFTASAVTMLFLFPGWGLGLWGRYGSAGLALIATAIIGVQIVAANLWLRGYVTGPAEWLWKTLAYARRQPWRRGAYGPLPAGLQAAE